MQSFLSRAKLPLAAAALVFAVGAASAMEYYYYNEPVACSEPSACSPCGTTYVPAPVKPVCNPCAGGPASTDLPGWYSNDYDYTTSSQVDTGITYVIPNQNGYVESHTIPLTNPVDQYYATHQVRNGQVVETGLPNPTNRSMAVYDEHGNMIRSYTQASASSPAQNVMQAGMNQTQNSINQAQPNMTRPLTNLNQTRATITQTQTTMDVPALSQPQSALNQSASTMNQTQNAINQAQAKVNAAQQNMQTTMQNTTNALNNAANQNFSNSMQGDASTTGSNFYDNVLSRDANSMDK